jgi:hypothetical protein
MVGAEEYWDRSAKNARDFEKNRSAPKKAKSTGTKDTSSRTFSDISATNPDKQWWETALETPIVKGILDAMSTGTYASANYSLNSTGTQEDRVKRATDELLKNPDDPFGAALGSIPNSPGAALLQGLSAGFGGNKNDAVTHSDVIKQAQSNNGIDPNSDQSQLVSGIGGLIGDVALDPSTYIGLGAAAHGVKGAVIGARDAGIAARSAKEGAQIGAETSRVKGAIEGAKKEVAKFRWQEFDRQEAKLLKKARRNDKVDTNYTEKIQGFKSLPEKIDAGKASKITSNDIKSAVKAEKLFGRNAAESGTAGAEATALMQKLIGEEVPPQTAEIGLKSIANAVEESPVGIGDLTAKVDPEPKTIGESVTFEQAPRANKANVPDSEVVVEPKKIIDDIPSEAKFGDYANYTPVDRFVMGTEHLTAPKSKYSGTTQAKVQAFMQANPDLSVLDYDALIGLGVKEADAGHVLTTGSLEGLTRNSGEFTDIFKGIKAGTVAPEDVDKFHQFMKGFTENPTLTIDEAVDKAAEFVKANSAAIQKSSRSFAPTAIHGRLGKLNNGA